jgi:hypothetical protein
MQNLTKGASMRNATDKNASTEEKDGRDGLYRFLSLDGSFTADLPVDADGLVVDYPELFW